MKEYKDRAFKPLRCGLEEIGSGGRVELEDMLDKIHDYVHDGDDE